MKLKTEQDAVSISPSGKIMRYLNNVLVCVVCVVAILKCGLIATAIIGGVAVVKILADAERVAEDRRDRWIRSLAGM